MKIKKFKFKQVVSTNKTAIRIIKKTKLHYGMIISDLQKKCLVSITVMSLLLSIESSHCVGFIELLNCEY